MGKIDKIVFYALVNSKEGFLFMIEVVSFKIYFFLDLYIWSPCL